MNWLTGANLVGVPRRALLVQLLALVILLVPGSASALAAEKGVAKFFGGNGVAGGEFGAVAGIAINQNGAGGVDPGDVYVLDSDNHRIQEFSATGEFVRAFGLGVGGPGVNVCTIASSCGAAEASAQAGGLVHPGDIAIDQATGTVYVIDVGGSSSANRVDAFSATGELEGSFGWNVKATGGAEELQFCTTESGCKAGSSGSGAGQLAVPGAGQDTIAVSPLNGHLIVGAAGFRAFHEEGGNWRIDEFAPTLEAGKVVGVSYVRGYGWGTVDGAEEFQTCTTSCHAPAPSPSPNVNINNPGTGWELGRFAESGEPADVGVGSSGTVYAINGWHEPFWNPTSIDRIETFSPTGNPEGVFAEIKRFDNALFVSASGDRLLTSGDHLTIYDLAGNVLETYFEGAGAFFPAVVQDESSEMIYLTVSTPERGVIIVGEPVPPTVSVEPVTAFTGTTATFEGRVDPTGFFAEYRFEYSSDGVHWVALPKRKLSVADSNEHAVSEEVTGLEAHTHYRVRLAAEKLYNSGRASEEASFETAAAPPATAAFGAEDVTDTGAELTATINPENEATSYRLECVSEAQFEASGYAEAIEVPAGGANIDPSGEGTEVKQQLSGLAPATEYRCRLTASNPTGSASVLETSFATYAIQSTGLPDGRAYEQATPVDKNGDDANGGQFRLRAALDGAAATYLITGGGSAEGGGQHFPVYSAMRGRGAWVSRGFWPSSTYGTGARMVGWSEDLRRDYVVVGAKGQPTLYEQDLEDGAMTVIAGGLAHAEGIDFAAESGDGIEVLFESEEALTPEGVAGASNLFLWNRATHELSLVDLLPNGSQPFHGAFAGPYNWANSDSKSGGGAAHYYTQQLHTLSEGGSTAFFTSYNTNQLYARTSLGTSSARTVQVSASQKTNGSGKGGADPKGPRKAAFMEATPDGRYVFFTSQEELTNDATTGTEDQGNDLYRYDTQSGELIDIAPDTADVNGAEVQGVLGSSADGSYVYFAANGMLAEGAGAGNCKSSPVTGWGHGGDCNIYLWHEGEIRFIATTTGEEGDALAWVPTSSNGCCTISMTTSRVSSTGTLLFASKGSPSAYDSEGKQELYRYEPAAGLGCVSCNPTGAPPRGDASIQSIRPGTVSVSGANAFWVRNLTDDGNRAFFETPDQLVAGDHNGVQDVYEWEAKGAGSCESEGQDGGCLYLISSGESAEPSYFDDASKSGDDVFFLTHQSLVRQDRDRLRDVYDARVGGGIASQNEEPQPRCEGEACKGAASPVPGIESAGSAGFAGPGNPNPSRHQHKKKRHTKKHRKRHSHMGRKHRRRGASRGSVRQG